MIDTVEGAIKMETVYDNDGNYYSMNGRIWVVPHEYEQLQTGEHNARATVTFLTDFSDQWRKHNVEVTNNTLFINSLSDKSRNGRFNLRRFPIFCIFCLC